MRVLESQVRLMIAARLSPNPSQLDAVDDLTQDTLMDLTRGIYRLENRTLGGLKGFVSVIASRKVFGYLRAAKAGLGQLPIRSLDSTVQSLSQAGPLWQFLSGSGPSPSFLAMRGEHVASLMTGLGGLKPEHREVIALAVFDQLGATEVAERMGISPKAASQLLIRATRKLRKNMASCIKAG